MRTRWHSRNSNSVDSRNLQNPWLITILRMIKMDFLHLTILIWQSAIIKIRRTVTKLSHSQEMNTKRWDLKVLTSTRHHHKRRPRGLVVIKMAVNRWHLRPWPSEVKRIMRKKVVTIIKMPKGMAVETTSSLMIAAHLTMAQIKKRMKSICQRPALPISKSRDNC